MKVKNRKLKYSRCKNCEIFKALMLKEKRTNQDEYLAQFATPESVIQEMNRLHNTIISTIKDQKYLIFWGEATKR